MRKSSITAPVKKLSLTKTVIARLNGKHLQQIVGGIGTDTIARPAGDPDSYGCIPTTPPFGVTIRPK